MDADHALLLVVYGAWTWLALRVAVQYDQMRRLMGKRGAPHAMALALGIMLAAAGAGLEQWWWLLFQAGNEAGLDTWWMQAGKPWLVPFAVLGAAGYLVHLRSYHRERGREHGWHVEAVMALAFGLALLASVQVLGRIL